MIDLEGVLMMRKVISELSCKLRKKISFKGWKEINRISGGSLTGKLKTI